MPLPKQEPFPSPPSPPAVEEGDGSGRRSARQASRALAGKRPAWAALMRGGADLSWWWSDDEDESDERKKRKRPARGTREPPARPRCVRTFDGSGAKRHAMDGMGEINRSFDWPGLNSTPTHPHPHIHIPMPRTVGRAPVQVFRGVVPKAAIDLLMKGERADESRNPWPGVNALLQSFMQRAFATSFRHPYIVEISSRCDSVGPPQRLDLALSPSGVRALLTPPAIAAIEVRLCSALASAGGGG